VLLLGACGVRPMIRARKVEASEAREYASYLTERVKDEAGYAASAAPAAGPRSGDYYLGTPGEPNAEPLGVWGGRGAELLGLRGTVDPEPMARLWEGREPTTGDPVIRPGPNGEHVPAIDMVVSVPKSVSDAWATEPDPARRAAIEAGATRATEAVMAIMEADCPLVARRIDGKMHREPAAGLVWSRFRHHTARTTAEQTARGDGADPDLHDHVLLANYAVRQDGTVGAIDSLAFFRAQRIYTQLHYAQLRREMHRLGYDTVRVGDHFELAGASQEVIDEFSSRSDAIDRATAEFRAQWGRQPTGAEHQQIVRSTRGGKDTNPLGDRDRWAAREAALDHRTLPRGIEDGAAVPLMSMAAINERARLRCDRGEVGQALRTTEEIAAEVLQEITTGDRRLSREAAVFETQDLHLAAARAIAGGRDGADIGEQLHPVLEAVMASGELRQLDREHWTTRRHRELEQSVLDAARTRATPAERALLSSTPSAAPPPERVEWHLAHARVPLDDEQQAAVRALCDERGLSMVLAEGGTGKGEVARVVADLYREQGYRIIAVSTAAQTAQRFGQDLGADEARSIDGLVHSCSRGLGLGSRTLVLADEVGQADTYRWADLLRAAGEAPIRGFGDTEQLDSVEAGGMLRVLGRELGAAPLSKVYRTRDEELIALWRKVRTGDRTAVEELVQRGAFEFVEGLPQAREGLVERWDADRVAGEELEGRPMGDFLMATNISNRQVDELNRLAQERRLERGEIAGPSTEVVVEDEARGYRRAERLHAGDQVRLVASGKVGEEHVRNGQVGRVVEIAEDGSAVVEIEGRREEAQRRLEDRQESARERFEQRTEAIRQGFEREREAAQRRYERRGVDPARIEGWQQAASERFEQRQAEARERFEQRQEAARAEFVAAGEGATVRFGAEKLSLLRLGYAGHDQTTQGRTSQTLDGLIGREATDRQSAYVELSRAREGARFHVALDQWQIPRERVVEPATAERAAVVEAIPWEERVRMATEAIAEAFERSRPKVAALEYEAQVLEERVREREQQLVGERQAIRREAARPATPRQVACARALGAKIPDGATWVEASTAIERVTGAEPGTFAREKLATRHDQERVDELLDELADQVLTRPEAVDAVRAPAAHPAEELEAGWRDVARVREEPSDEVAAVVPEVAEAALGDRAEEVPRGGGAEDGSVRDVLVPEVPSASREEPPAASMQIDVEAVAEPALEALRPPAGAGVAEPGLPEAAAELMAAVEPEEGHDGALEAAVEASEVPPATVARRLSLADLDAAEAAYLAELRTPEPAPDPAAAAVDEGPPPAEGVAVSVDRQEEPPAEPDVDVAASAYAEEEHGIAEPERLDPEAEQLRAAEPAAELEVGPAAPERGSEGIGEGVEAEVDVEWAREVEAEPASPAEPEPRAEPLGPEWSYDLWAEPTADWDDDDRRAGRGMDME
jgi:conjugative relaxase-like TrwC/TraI family protein